jgi:hypothetical protein
LALTAGLCQVHVSADMRAETKNKRSAGGIGSALPPPAPPPYNNPSDEQPSCHLHDAAWR